MNKLKFKPPVIENGFVIGEDWNTHKTIMVGVHSILKITLDVGNQPAANRIAFIDGHMPHVDLVAVPEEADGTS